MQLGHDADGDHRVLFGLGEALLRRALYVEAQDPQWRDVGPVRVIRLVRADHLMAALDHRLAVAPRRARVHDIALAVDPDPAHADDALVDHEPQREGHVRLENEAVFLVVQVVELHAADLAHLQQRIFHFRHFSWVLQVYLDELVSAPCGSLEVHDRLFQHHLVLHVGEARGPVRGSQAPEERRYFFGALIGQLGRTPHVEIGQEAESLDHVGVLVLVQREDPDVGLLLATEEFIGVVRFHDHQVEVHAHQVCRVQLGPSQVLELAQALRPDDLVSGTYASLFEDFVPFFVGEVQGLAVVGQPHALSVVVFGPSVFVGSLDLLLLHLKGFQY